LPPDDGHRDAVEPLELNGQRHHFPAVAGPVVK